MLDNNMEHFFGNICIYCIILDVYRYFPSTSCSILFDASCDGYITGQNSWLSWNEKSLNTHSCEDSMDDNYKQK